MTQRRPAAFAVLARLLLFVGVLAMHFPAASHADAAHSPAVAQPAAVMSDHHAGMDASTKHVGPIAAPLCPRAGDCTAGEHELCLADRLGLRSLLAVPVSAVPALSLAAAAAPGSVPAESGRCRGPDLRALGVSRT